jgi:lipopolysaccharide/colanic/teichoic acid biosynthesis glycosyltransferase
MKRGFDVLVAGTGLLLTSPILLAAAVAIKLDSRGPVFYSGPRVGRGGRVFQIHKLRSMQTGADAKGPAVTAGDDARITAVGRVLRRSKLDELPQLLNVLKGDMSLVGPRPEHPRYVESYTPDQRRLLDVRPGITGPAALAFIDEEERLRGGDSESLYIAEVMPQKLAIELAYIQRKSFASDMAILFRTAGAMLRRRRRS